MIKMFKELLTMTQEQSNPQRLLLLFAKAEASNTKKSKKHQRGTISPVMCVDKLPEEISTFATLVKEADAINKDWDFIFIASLSGEEGQAPSTEDAEPFLNKMANDIETGNGMGRYVIFDGDEKPIELAIND